MGKERQADGAKNGIENSARICGALTLTERS